MPNFDQVTRNVWRDERTSEEEKFNEMRDFVIREATERREFCEDRVFEATVQKRVLQEWDAVIADLKVRLGKNK